MWYSVSSANSLKVEVIEAGKSLMKERKRLGSSTDPLGTPERTGLKVDVNPLTTTACFLFVRKSWIKLWNFPIIP